jgi:putative ABC transport system substrate-binding protein
MCRREVLAGLGTIAIAASLPANAQQAADRRTIGFLSANSRAAMSARTEAFERGLRELSNRGGDTIVVEYRFADGQPDRVRALADELVSLKVRLIVTEGPTATYAARNATATIPIVMAQDPDPVGTGLVRGVARPGGNITGLSTLRPDLEAKRLELLREVIPNLARVAVLKSATTPGAALSANEIQRTATAAALRVEYFEITKPDDIAAAFQVAVTERADAVLVMASPLLLSRRREVVGFAERTRIPVIYYTREFVTDGGLMSYGVSATALFHRAADFVDRILRGANPADLPIEQPASFELVVNLKSAKALGLTLPNALITRADELIE